MKRLISLLVVLMLVASCLPALADIDLPTYEGVFTIRNGISFGMSKEDVKTRENATLAGWMSIVEDQPYLCYEGIELVGFDNAELNYYFTEQDELYSFAYSRSTRKYSPLDFNVLKNILTQKYGEPIIPDNRLAKFSTVLWDTTLGFSGDENRANQITDYTTWYVKYDNGIVVIELAKSNLNGNVGLGYRLISQEQWEKWMIEIKEENQESAESYMDSFNNDL